MIDAYDLAEMAREIRAAGDVPRITVELCQRWKEGRRVRSFIPMPLIAKSKGKKLRIAILTKNLRS